MNAKKSPIILFHPGRIVATPNALATLSQVDIAGALRRHFAADWGECCTEDWNANDFALENGGRLFSSFKSENGAKFWIITEGDRSATTVLMPEDY